jgi:hypothetical protein
MKTSEIPGAAASGQCNPVFERHPLHDVVSLATDLCGSEPALVPASAIAAAFGQKSQLHFNVPPFNREQKDPRDASASWNRQLPRQLLGDSPAGSVRSPR